ncbi:uncharacterized protein LOC130732287 [Lotus japonicus]|uniref:uncharacterized protein LOC130732287 n=1 Tax=Lotus japonicus TaxID=34305 RepID=UPI0025871FF3|nr:uncharacterized protein LOC130732287 [Lotus japonicus]XP_057440350.1 uncharacterized protein LOC130732287 [Lotus japonicus]XP_057440351.1 uncharacterized protein LOC130732287 [Lotus japonicus]
MKENSGKRRNVCLAVTGGVVVTIVLLVVILALTVFKPQHPITKVDSIQLQDMDMNFDMFRMRIDLNVTLHADVTVKNPNKFGFKYSNGTAEVSYRGEKIGEAPIPSGEISSGESKGMNLTLTVMADRFFNNPQYFSDAKSGTLPLNTVTKIAGEVSILGFIKFHVESFSSCDFSINLNDKTVVEKMCHYKSKI